MKLSLVVPSYNEEGNVEKFYNEVARVFEGHVADYELVFVNDGSKDDCAAQAADEIEKLRKYKELSKKYDFDYEEYFP